MKTGTRAINRISVTILLFFFCTRFCLALPTGQQVVSGHVGFSQQGGSLTVTNTPNSIINWQSFSIGRDEAVRFIQQSTASSVLNRIAGQNPSLILGALTSNGKVFLINPNGIVFGRGAQINVNDLVASTLGLSNEDFLSGKYNFTQGQNAGAIKNRGTITTPEGGTVYLIAPTVENHGIIDSPGGQVLLAAGHTVSLVDSEDPDVAVVVSAPSDKALNLGRIVARAGKIGIYAGLLEQGGLVSADSVSAGNGSIVFKASTTVLDAKSTTTANGPSGGRITIQGGSTSVDGIVSAAGTGNKGGEIQILGDGIEVAGTVDASGKTGGGTILIGGDSHGANSLVQNATTTAIGPSASIGANALSEGDGGKIVVWSDDATVFSGAISAKGGPSGGNGGTAEVSGRQSLLFQGTADLSAPAGKTGSLLLDPTDFTVGVDMTGQALSSALNLSNITIQTGDTGPQAGNIYVNDGISWTSANTLTMNAYHSIFVNNTLTNNGGGSLVLGADMYGKGSGTVSFGSLGHVSLSGGGTALIFYNPPGGYTAPTNYAGYFSGVTPTAFMLVNTLDNFQAMNTNLAGAYALGRDIDGSATSGWNNGAGFVPIGYSGNNNSNPLDLSSLIFYGNGHTVSNIFIYLPSSIYVGVFGGKGSPVIEDLWLTDVNITGGYQTGGAIAHTSGTTNGCFVTGTVTSTAGDPGVVGGLVGLNAGLIINSYSDASVTAPGATWTGGLVGCQWGQTARIVNSYSTGSVSGSSPVGGLVGGNFNTQATPVTSSYWDTTTSGQSSSAGGAGLTSVQMESQSSYTGWDFANTWAMQNGRPVLRAPSTGGLVIGPSSPSSSPLQFSPLTGQVLLNPGVLGTNPTQVAVNMLALDINMHMLAWAASPQVALPPGTGGVSLTDILLADLAGEFDFAGLNDGLDGGNASTGDGSYQEGLNYQSLAANANLPGIGGSGSIGGSGASAVRV